MRKVVLSVAALVGFAMPAIAADMQTKAVKIAEPVYVSPWDVAFGTALSSDYVLRGISQSDRGASVSGYVEPRFNINKDLQIYAGVAGFSLWTGFADAEFDIYGGIRPTFGALAFDFGVTYYKYPGINPLLIPLGETNGDFGEVYAKVAWTVNDWLTLGANGVYSNNFANFGDSYFWVSGTAKATLPWSLFAGQGTYISGEIGYQGYENTLALAFTTDTTFWNAGIGFTYKAATLDLRYHDTNLTNAECFALVGGRNFCGATFVAKLAFDTTLAAIK